jgi:thiol-disulfide isomerase/thioredoxin
MKLNSIIYGATLLLALFITSCATNTGGTFDIPGQEDLAVPSSFTQKVLVEEYTATWCGYCPDMPVQLQPFEEDNHDRVYVNGVHLSDEMYIAQNDSLASEFDITGIPSITVNRIKNSYTSAINTALADEAKLGVGINSIVDQKNYAAIAVNVGFIEDISIPLTVAVFLVEDSLVYDQVNYYNDDESSLFYQAGDPIEGYVHKGVVREVLTNSVFGDPIPSDKTKKGQFYTKEFLIDVSQYDVEHLSIIAVAGRSGENYSGEGIFNVQKAEVGRSKGWE